LRTVCRNGIVIRIGALAIAAWTGCATVPETAWNVLEVEGMEAEVVCSGACEEEWRRAEEWVKKYSGYAFPAEVVVTPDRIEAMRLPLDNCESIPRPRRWSLADCPRLPLASEPLGLGIDDPPAAVRIGKTLADGGPYWTFLVFREPIASDSFRVRLVQSCRSRSGPRACDLPGIRRNRQDRFRRFVGTGEHLSQY
jgi:hypothetical protein